MKHVRSRAIFYCCFLQFVLGVGLVLLSACGNGGGSSGISSSGSGSIVFDVELQSSADTGAPARIDCDKTNIDTIEAKVLDERGRVIARGGPWECEDHEGTITGVEAGNNRTVVLDAKDSSGNTIYQGESDPVTVIAGQTTYAGTITLIPVWVISTIDSEGDSGRGTSIAASQIDDSVHIAYIDAANDRLKYASNGSGNWKREIVRQCGLPSVYSCQDPSIALESPDKVHISYYGLSRGLDTVEYATNAFAPPPPWRVGHVDWGDVGSNRSIALDSLDNVHISYHDTTNRDLKYAMGKQGKWEIADPPPDSSGNTDSSSIAIDSGDFAHISYYNLPGGVFNLKYATNIPQGFWQPPDTIDSYDTVSDEEAYTSIALDLEDAVHISYYDQAHGNLKYVTGKFKNWGEPEIVDSSTNVGFYTSIALDSSGNVHISYYDLKNRDLKYATNASGAWVTYTVDTAGDVGSFTSIAIDSNDNVHISYYDATNGDLKYATKATH